MQNSIKTVIFFAFATLLFACNHQEDTPQDFEALNNSLEIGLDNSINFNEMFMEDAKNRLKWEGNNPKDIAILSKAEAIKKRSNSLKEELDELKVWMIKQSGGRDSDSQQLKNPGISVDFAQEKIQGIGSKLNELTGWIRKEYAAFVNPASFPDLADKQPKQFYNTSFEGRSLAASLAKLSELQLKVIEYQRALYINLDLGHHHVYAATNPIYESVENYIKIYQKRDNWKNFLSLYSNELYFKDIMLDFECKNLEEFKKFYDWPNPDFKKVSPEQNTFELEEILYDGYNAVIKGTFNPFYWKGELQDWNAGFTMWLFFDEDKKIIKQLDLIKYPSDIMKEMGQ